MNAKQIVRLPEPRKDIAVELREVVRDVAGTPHVFVRVRLTGWHFPQRALEPFALIGTTVSKFVVIEPGGTGLNAYFDVRPPAARRITVGYGNIVAWDFDIAIDPARLERLDRTRLPPGLNDLHDSTTTSEA